ncbi:hypothetical protein GCM10023191_024970 [Actinoallomurus oryzae]|uniref:Peptidase S8/S53 domain-containing protein n=1 Tax=Actinoallomurus oryzae TaxID=502180 RepID=A0ABP8PRT5_9ACTN
MFLGEAAGPAGAAPTPAPRPSATASSPGATDLPLMPAQLGFDAPCTGPSHATVTRVPWPQVYLGLDRAWTLSTGRDVTIGVVGTGVDDAGALSGRVRSLTPVAGGETEPADCVGHGTFVAALAAASRRPGVGFAGAAPDATLLAVRATEPDGTTTGKELARGLRAAVGGGARVVVVASSVTADDRDLAAAVTDAARHDVVVVAPASVQASTASSVRAWPAAYPAAVSVAGIAPGGALGAPPADGARTDLLAPGYQVMSVGPGGAGNFAGSDDAFAAAYVAGTAALVRSYRPGLSAVEVVRRLEETAAHPGGVLPHPSAGYGAVDPYAAVADVVAEPYRPGLAAPLRLRHTNAAGSPGRTALWLTAVLLAAVAALGAVAVAVPRGRARRWRPDGVPAVRTASTLEKSEE